MSTNSNKQYRYFLYSAEQEATRKQIESSAGKKFNPGQVLVNGSWKPFTQMSKSSENTMFADSKIVAKGYIEDVQYKEPTSTWKTQ